MGRKKKKKGKEEQALVIQEIKVFRYSSDDWHPCFESSKVRVGLVTYEGSGERWPGCNLVNVWGEDDTGMEKNFETLCGAVFCFAEILSWDDITKSKLKELGFVSA